MAKKFLLYIHSPEFEKEANKSDLVNGLLNQHYTGNLFRTEEEPSDIEKDIPACCTGAKRCKHWYMDESKGVWINENTKEEVDPWESQ